MCRVYIGVTGLSGTGKDAVADVLADIAESYGMHVYRRNLSDEVREELARRGRSEDSSSRAVLITLANELRQSRGEGILARQVVAWHREIHQSEDPRPSVLIAVGIRNPGEVEVFRSQWEDRFLLVSVEAAEEVRSLRVASRGQYEEDADLKEEVREADKAIGIPDCSRMANWLISNNGTIHELQAAVQRFFNHRVAPLIGFVVNA